MAKYYISFQTIANFINLPLSPNFRSILEMISRSDEFGLIRYHGDKGDLNKVNKHPEIRYKLKGKASGSSDKVFLMIQILLGSVSLNESASSYQPSGNELNMIIPEALRLSRGFLIP
jgi:hypothetical protein